MMRDRLKRLEALSAVIFSAVLGIGAWAQFTLPYYRGGPMPQGCHFGDALIVFISCDASVPGWVEQVIMWAWYLTWGWFWVVGFFIPFSPLVSVPLAIIWLTIIALAGRWTWRTVARRLHSLAPHS